MTKTIADEALIERLEQGAVDLDHAGNHGGAQLMRDALEALATRSSTADEGMVRALDALEPLALLAGGDVNMNDPLSKWFRVGQFYEAREVIAAMSDRLGNAR